MWHLCPPLGKIFLGVRLLTQSIAPTAKEALVSKTAIGATCMSYQGSAMASHSRHLQWGEAVSLSNDANIADFYAYKMHVCAYCVPGLCSHKWGTRFIV